MVATEADVAGVFAFAHVPDEEGAMVAACVVCRRARWRWTLECRR